MPARPRLLHLINSAQRRLQLWTASEQDRYTSADGPAPSPAQGGVLFVLLKNDGATMGELAKELDLVPSAVSGLVQRMEALEWVRRRPCVKDARTQRVWIQPLGSAQLPSLREALGRINAQLTAGFSEAELQTVVRWLEHVKSIDAISASSASPPSATEHRPK
ncbi:MarR family winged helix-turn-helix transcriptional regulator [Ottowia thiooxydans]|uniref:MarR family winged helix-turn-helix transcriptional regulator n=1 Tax=Ottowia thiooxydans TaxID=219182 RepID=UPI0006882FFC|nr:MarR family transcriptional regulator [Ottowia thiooxydans]